MQPPKRQSKAERQRALVQRIKQDPFVTDAELARSLGVSVHTVRLDRHQLQLPEVRERIRTLAADAYKKVKTLSGGEVFGELVDVELGVRGISLMETTAEMGFHRTKIIRGHHLFAQANSLAVAIIDAEVALTGTAHVRFLRPAQVGERLVAKAEVIAKHGRQYTVKVQTRADEEIIFQGEFIIFAIENGKGQLDEDCS